MGISVSFTGFFAPLYSFKITKLGLVIFSFTPSNVKTSLAKAVLPAPISPNNETKAPVSGRCSAKIFARISVSLMFLVLIFIRKL